MKVAVFSDIHGNYQALDAILNDVKKQNIDKTIFLGDSISLGPSPYECIDRLMKENITFINGNHELYLLDRKFYDEDMTEIEIEHNLWVLKKLKNEHIEYILKQPLSYSLTINNKKYLFIHFFQENATYPFKHISIFKTDEYKKVFDSIDYNYCFYGHYHQGRIDKYNNKYFYGIGSSGCVKSNKTFYYIIDDNNIQKIEIEFNREEFNKIIYSTQYPDKENISKIFF